MVAVKQKIAETLVNSEKLDDQKDARFAVLDNGDFVFTYMSLADDSIYRDIYMRRFNSNGAEVAAESKVNLRDQPGTFNADAHRPSVVWLDGKSWVVSWTSGGQDGSGESIYARLFDNGAGGPEIQINSTTASNQSGARLARLTGGGFVAVWYDESGASPDPNPGSAVRARVFSADGTPLGNDFVVNTTITSIQYEPSVAALPGNKYVVTWTDASAALGQAQDIRGRIFNGDGTATGASSEFVIPAALGNNQIESDVTALGNGNFVVTWTDWADDHVKGAIFSASGTRLASITVSQVPNSLNHGYSSTAALDDGRFVVVWEDSRGGPTDKNIRGRLFTNAGEAASDEFVVNATLTGNQLAPSVVALPGGTFAVTWTDELFDGNGTAVMMRTFDAGLLNAGNTGETLIGGTRDDTLIGGTGGDSLFGRVGGDRLFGNAGLDFILGGDGNDVASGGNDRDLIYGEAGLDVLFGDGGDDFLAGGADRDWLYSGNGLDVLFGGDGDDVLSGDADRDWVYGEAGLDLLFGGDGDDVVAGGADADTVIGGAGADALFGEAGDDFIFAEAGNDFVVGGAGYNQISLAGGLDIVLSTNGDAGTQYVIDFSVADGDQVWLVGSGFASAAAALASAVDLGGTTYIGNGNDAVYLAGIAPSQLSAGNIVLL